MSADKRNIRDMLPGYVRNTLSGEDRKRVDEALAVDASLREYCLEITDYFEKIKSLRGLSAPGGFAQGVMRRINEARGKKSFLSKVFMPLQVKLPLELAGVAVTAAFLIFVYHPFGVKVTEKNQDLAISVPAGQKDENREEMQIPAEPARSYAEQAKTAGSTAPVPASSKRHAKKTATDKKMPRVALAQKSEEAEQRIEERTYAEAAPAPKAMASATRGYPATGEESETRERDVGAGLMEQAGDARRSAEHAYVPSQKTGREMRVRLVLNIGHGNQGLADPAVERAVGAAKGNIVARKQDVPEKGMVRYTIKVPSSSYDSLASGLAKLGRLSVTGGPTGRSGGDIDVELIVGENR